MISRSISKWTAVLGGVLATALPGAAHPEVNPAAKLTQRYASTVVNLHLVVTMKATVAGQTMPPRELKRDAVGTVISPDGLVVLSLAAIDPAEFLTGMRISTPKGSVQVESASCEFTEVKIVQGGVEIPARIILKDADLDLAFAAPIAEPARQFAYVDLSMAAVPAVLDTGYIVSRASRAHQGAVMIQRSDILAVVGKPRRRMIVQTSVQGCPMFDAGGLVYGICLRQISNGRPSGSIVLSAGEIAEIAKQAEAIERPSEPSAAPPSEQPKP